MQTGVLHSQWIPVLWVQINHEEWESDYCPGNSEDEERGYGQSGGRCSVHHDTTVIYSAWTQNGRHSFHSQDGVSISVSPRGHSAIIPSRPSS